MQPTGENAYRERTKKQPKAHTRSTLHILPLGALFGSHDVVQLRLDDTKA